MILDRFSSSPSSLLTNRVKGLGPTYVNDNKGGGEVAFQGAAPVSVSLSPESQDRESPSERVAALTSGLASWSQADTSSTSGNSGVGQLSENQGVGETGQPAQVPISMIRTIVDKLKSSDGMAAVGTFGALLSWARKEKSANGKIRPEFQELLREAIAYARRMHMMKDEDLARIEESLFSTGDGEGKGKKGGGGLIDKSQPVNGKGSRSGTEEAPVVHPPRNRGGGRIAPLPV